MRYMLLMDYGGVAADIPPMSDWTPEDISAHIEFQLALDEQLTSSGELVDSQGLAGPDQAKFVVANGQDAPLVTDTPLPEGKELVAGYRIVEVDRPDRAIEIAAKMSAAPGPAGAPIRQRIEVREVMSAPTDPEL